MIRKNNKRGISPLIATVLIIGFTIVLAAMVITWGSKLFQTTVAGTEETSQFNLLCTTGFSYEGTATRNSVDGTYNVAVSNKNDKNVAGFLFVLKNTDESTSVITSNEALDNPITIPSGRSVAPTAGLGPFGTGKYAITLEAQPTNLYTSVEVRAIAEIASGKRQVCSNEQLVTIKTV